MMQSGCVYGLADLQYCRVAVYKAWLIYSTVEVLLRDRLEEH